MTEQMVEGTRHSRLRRPATTPIARRLRRRLHGLSAAKPAVVVPVLILLVALACALAPSWIAPFDPTDIDGDAILQAPGAAHWLGTDHFGRDVLSLLVYGARQSLLIGVCAVTLGSLLGGTIGLVSGYAGGIVEMAAMRLIDIWLSVPEILLAIIIATALKASFASTILAIGLVIVPGFARVMRAQVLATKTRPFIEASRSIGTSPTAILLRHILPHTLPPMLVLATLSLASSILIGATLSFIGVGVVDDRPDWGFLLSQGRGYLTVAWWFATFPGMAITALVISANLLGDALRDRLDPHARTR
jgi:peptide/nickel transport system permease protein